MSAVCSAAAGSERGLRRGGWASEQGGLRGLGERSLSGAVVTVRARLGCGGIQGKERGEEEGPAWQRGAEKWGGG